MLGIPRHRPIAQDDKPIDDNSLGDCFVPGKFHVATCIVGAVARDIDGTATTFERCTLQLGGRELDAATDRGTVGEGTRQFQELIAKFTRWLGAVYDRPVDQELLCAETRPFDEANSDALLRAGFDRLEHVRVGDRSRVAFALQQEFRMVDAARDIRRQHQ